MEGSYRLLRTEREGLYRLLRTKSEALYRLLLTEREGSYRLLRTEREALYRLLLTKSEALYRLLHTEREETYILSTKCRNRGSAIYADDRKHGLRLSKYTRPHAFLTFGFGGQRKSCISILCQTHCACKFLHCSTFIISYERC
jgi:hypothetical protein